MGVKLISLLHQTSSHNRPGQIAWAIVLGCALGLLPKTSLLLPIALCATFCLPIHFVAAMVSMLAVTMISPIVHPLLGNLGHWLLQHPWLAEQVQRVDRLPLGPWLKLHNTVVIGATVASATATIPAVWLAKLTIQAPYTRWLHLQLERQLEAELSAQVAASSSAAKVAASLRSVARPPVENDVEPKPLAATLSLYAVDSDHTDSSNVSTEVDEAVVNQHVRDDLPLAMDSDVIGPALTEAIDSIHALEDLLDKVQSDGEQPVDADTVLARATKASALVDEILHSLDALAAIDSERSIDNLKPESAELHSLPITAGPDALKTVRIDTPEVHSSHDTTISIYRRARTGETTVTSSDLNHSSEKVSMASTNVAPGSSLPDTTNDSATANGGLIVRSDRATDDAARRDLDARHEEALRYLLSHLRTLKDKV